MRCASCGGFYNQACAHWPNCVPEIEEPKLSDYSFQIYVAIMLGAIFGILVFIWVKL